MSLYADLLDPKPDASASISRGPVLFKQPGEGGEGKDDGNSKKPPVPCQRALSLRDEDPYLLTRCR